jgi:2-polyprenyl-6-methoxyphenol hydroxylase-like FAD-dependent oxidoreductase
MNKPRAIIIGCGIGGLAAAIALNQRGIGFHIYERASVLGEVGAGLSLWANAIKALAKLGLADELKALSVPQISGGIRSWRGELISAAPPRDLERRLGTSLVIVVHRAELHSAMCDRVGRDSITLGAQCVGFEQSAEGAEARFADGTEARGDFLIGADGINSAIRAQMFGKTKPRYSGYTAWRAVVRFRHNRLPYRDASETWGRGARFGMIPMSEDRIYWFATKNAPEGEKEAPSERKHELLYLFRDWHEPIEAIIEATDDDAILRNDIYDREPLVRWSEGRVTLLGDAAHPMTPTLGQGACQAIEDAVALGQCFDNGDDVESALGAYEKRRLERTTEIVKQSWRIGRIAQWQNPFACALRNNALKMIPGATQMKQLEWIIGYEV